MADAGWFGAMIPSTFGGSPLDFVSYGLLHEEVGRACSSTRCLLTVHSMVSSAIVRWGSPEVGAAWLPRLARGECLGAFALSEPNVGSDASAVETQIVRSGAGYVVNGTKRWITCGQVAGLFLVFGKLEGANVAVLVPRDSPGVTLRPIPGLLGCRAAMLAQLELRDCTLPENSLLGGRGFGLSHVALAALDIGRYSIAWGSLGLLRACLEASVRYTNERKQFGVAIGEHQLVRHLISDMLTEFKAARLLCLDAGWQREAGDPDSILAVTMAKYYASTAAMRAAANAVQLHGANGCSHEFQVERYFRDAKVMEIIEGSSQIQQLMIAKHASGSLDFDLPVRKSEQGLP
jgi:alkylation response protein AidB-like acyl-CoA dehydrogenase